MVGRGDEPRQDRRLAHGQVGGVHREVGLCRGLHAVGALAEVDGVEVLREDAVLVHAILELPGERRFVDLATERVGRAHVEDLHELLGDRGATLDHRALGGVHVGGAGDRPAVHPVVVVEAAVLDRHHGIAQVGGHVALAQHDPVLGGMELGDQGAVRGVQERRLGQRQGLVVVELRQVAGRGQRGEHDERDARGEEAAGLHRQRVYPRVRPGSGGPPRGKRRRTRW